MQRPDKRQHNFPHTYWDMGTPNAQLTLAGIAISIFDKCQLFFRTEAVGPDVQSRYLFQSRTDLIFYSFFIHLSHSEVSRSNVTVLLTELKMTQMDLIKGCNYRAWLSRQTKILYQRHPSMWRLSRAEKTERQFVVNFLCSGTQRHVSCQMSYLIFREGKFGLNSTQLVIVSEREKCQD